MRLVWIALAIVQAGVGCAAAQGLPTICTKKNCKQMSNCAEAVYDTFVCGDADHDRDHDGIPCEGLCPAASTRVARQQLHLPDDPRLDPKGGKTP